MLTGAMLAKLDPKAVIAGNVKISPLEALDEMLVRPDATPVVVELSSWLLESLPVALTELKKGPDIAVFTNVFPDHLNRYASYEDYIKSKEIILSTKRRSSLRYSTLTMTSFVLWSRASKGNYFGVPKRIKTTTAVT